jgi:C4-dicarboxylate-specific signal transduction histidine kinase
MRKALSKTLDRAGVMRNMSDRLIGMAKQSDTAVKAVCVASVVQAALECLGRDPAKDNITVNVQIDPDLKVRANEGGLTQVLFNLVINARQAMLSRGRGRLTIDAAPTPDGKVEISVRDTGCGIAPENLSRIFEPFFSTKTDAAQPDRRGLGLGLSICKDIIEELGGRMSVKSEVNVGTTFTIQLARADV